MRCWYEAPPNHAQTLLGQTSGRLGIGSGEKQPQRHERQHHLPISKSLSHLGMLKAVRTKGAMIEDESDCKRCSCQLMWFVANANR